MIYLLDANVLIAATISEHEHHQRATKWLADIEAFATYADLAGVVGHRQVTDAYLAALARSRFGKVATFDEDLCALRPEHTHPIN